MADLAFFLIKAVSPNCAVCPAGTKGRETSWRLSKPSDFVYVVSGVLLCRSSNPVFPRPLLYSLTQILFSSLTHCRVSAQNEVPFAVSSWLLDPLTCYR